MRKAVKAAERLRRLLHAGRFKDHGGQATSREDAWITDKARSYGLEMEINHTHADFRRGNDVVRSSERHRVYWPDIAEAFDYYFQAVEPLLIDRVRLVDYSTPRYHWVNGFGLMPILFPAFSEPLASSDFYLNFADLQEGATAIDLGAYSGLTSILFKSQVGCNGTVIAVEADPENLIAVQRNLQLYKAITNLEIPVLHAAVWSHCEGLTFSSEGNMGSAAQAHLEEGRGNQFQVESITLSALVDRMNLTAVDLIKCDIEGAELEVFLDAPFFERFRPKIILEVHWIDGTLTSQRCQEVLSRYGYSCQQIEQPGVRTPLLGFTHS